MNKNIFRILGTIILVILLALSCNQSVDNLITNDETKNQEEKEDNNERIKPLLDVGEYYVFGGDILLDKEDPQHQEIIKSLLSPDRGFKDVFTLTWPSKKVYYYFDSTVSTVLKDNIKRIMEDLEFTCGVDFVASSPGNYRYHITQLSSSDPAGGYSTLGYCWNAKLQLKNDSSDYVITHELLHGLGFGHEHQRPDAWKYINIHYENIINGYKHNFYPWLGQTYTTYDYYSIMHYGRYAFSVNGASTIYTIDQRFRNKIGQRDLSSSDIKTLKKLYGNSHLRYDYYFPDINGDGRADIVKVQRYANKGWIGLGQTNGSFTRWSQYSRYPGATKNYVHYFADINGDGRDDWIQVAKTSNMGWIGLGQSNGSVDFWTNSSSARGATNNYSHYFADINGDGRDDWIQVAKTSNMGWIGLGQSNGNINHWTNSSNSRGGTNNYSHYFADINGDGRDDWIQVARTANYGWIGLGQSNGNINHWTNMSRDRGAIIDWNHYFADINGDGRDDWIQVAKVTNRGYIGLGQSNGNVYHWTNSSSARGATKNYVHYFADINGDGRDDWIQVVKTSNMGWIGLGQSNGNIAHWTNSSNNRGATNNYNHYFADVNGDGRDDWIQIANDGLYGWTGLGQSNGNVTHWNHSYSLR